MCKILVTGAGGYIGSRAAEYFMKRGFEVTGLLHKKVSPRFVSSGAKGVFGDLCDFPSLDALFSAPDAKFDYVVHTGARASDTGRDADFRIPNYESVKHLANLCMAHNVKRFVYLSTSDVYGLHDFNGETEDELSFDHTAKHPYPKYKILSEEYLASHLPAERFACVRPCVVFGDGDTTITPRAVDFIRNSPFVPHFGRWKGLNRWPLAHVRNVCGTLYSAMLLPEAGGRGVTVLDTKRTALNEFYFELAARYLPERRLRTVCLPLWSVMPLAWTSSALSTLFRRQTPIFDPTLYSLATITHNLDFSNARMLEYLKKTDTAYYECE